MRKPHGCSLVPLITVGLFVCVMLAQAIQPEDLEEKEIENIWRELWKSGGGEAQMPKVEKLIDQDVNGDWIVNFGVSHQPIQISLRRNSTVETSGDQDGKEWRKQGNWRVVDGKMVLFMEDETLPGFIFKTGKKIFIFDPWAKGLMSELQRHPQIPGENVSHLDPSAAKFRSTEVTREGKSLEPQFSETNALQAASQQKATAIGAIDALRKLAEDGDSDAAYRLGRAYYKGEGVPLDGKEAKRWFLKSAEQGNAEGQWGMGAIYFTGLGVSRDFEQAFVWWKKAADNGHAGSALNIALLYRDGIGKIENEAEYLKWLEVAAKRGDADAQFEFAECYRLGKGKPHDDAVAIEWLTKAAEQNQPEAQERLAGAYYNGIAGLKRNPKKAAELFEKAALAGRPDAQAHVSGFYTEGTSVAVDYDKAFKFADMSARQGNQLGQLYLARLYFMGWGTQKDKVEAYKWFALVERQGGDTAKEAAELLEIITPTMTEEEIREGKRRVIDNLERLGAP